ncbi:MAG TPA: hypothetical protein PLG66_21860, partial [Calditrichia bacterium]|nr:hypothetical protein [Calditrichia bacterium]
QSLSKPKPAATQPVVRQTPPPARKEPTRLQGDLQIVERINANKIELDQSLRRMRQVRDEANRVTFYFNKNISHYVYKNSLEIYIIDHDDRPPLLRMRIYYHDTDWLNIRGYEVYADDREYAIPVAPEWIERGRGSGGAWEWCDIPVTASELIAINAVKDASWNAVRYIGERRVFERTMTEDEKLRLAYVLRAYRALEQRESLLLTESR